MSRLNDHQAIDATNSVLEQYFRLQLNPTEAIRQIAIISGRNALAHEEAQQ